MSMRCPPGTTPYTIRPGDTFFALARRFGTTVAALVSANPFVDPDNLQIGQRICLPRQPQFPACPEGNFYTIRPGDTFFSLARLSWRPIRGSTRTGFSWARSSASRWRCRP